jgi:hypothetical protein
MSAIFSKALPVSRPPLPHVATNCLRKFPETASVHLVPFTEVQVNGTFLRSAGGIVRAPNPQARDSESI